MIMNNDNKERDYDQQPTSLEDVDVNLTPEQAEAIGWHLAKSGLVIPTSLVCEACKAKLRSREQSQNNSEYRSH